MSYEINYQNIITAELEIRGSFLNYEKLSKTHATYENE